MINLKTVLLFVLMISLITIVHELGHLLAAKAFGVYCKEFSVGMGPKLFGKKFKETEYNFRPILIGGYVSMVGEQDDDPDVETLNIPKERTLKGIAKWKQLIVMFAGIFMNFVMAWLIYSLIILNIGTYVQTSKPIIETIDESMPAYNSGLKEGDIISEVKLSNGMSVKPESYDELVTFLVSYYDGNGSWQISVDRNGNEYEYNVTPSYNETEQRYIIGITFSTVATKTTQINIFNCFNV